MQKSPIFFRLVFTGSILVLMDIYVYQAFQSQFNSILWKSFFYGSSLLVTIPALYIFLIDRKAFSNQFSNMIVGLFVTFFMGKLVVASVLFLEDIYRFTIYIFTNSHSLDYLPRNTFVSQVAIALASVLFFALIHGILVGKYNYKVLRHTLYFDNLPEIFDGYQITHISDIHCGSFDNIKKVKFGINLINQQQSDIILFTGDIINLYATELIPWKDVLRTLKAKDGVFSVLGNHDYGDYVRWNSQQEKDRNFALLKSIQKEMGYQLLLNESHFITRGNDRLAIIGVENWGTGFVKKGDLGKATEKLKSSDFNILMSHDPTHWEAEILNDTKYIHLTLSGHTHGMQFGIEIPGLVQWSPIKYRYKLWAGIYKNAGRFININRGFGFLGFPGRVGIWPEISIIELKRK